MMDEIRKNTVELFRRKYKIKRELNTQESYEIMKLFYGAKIKACEVYNKSTKTWIKLSDADDNCFNPSDYGYTTAMPINNDLIECLKKGEL